MGEYRELTNGYSYKLTKELEHDEHLCNAEFEVLRYGHNTENLWEIQRYTKELIEDIMKNKFNENYISYDKYNSNIVHIGENIYSLDWPIKVKKNRYKLLMDFCIGNQIRILSGELEGKVGFYFVKENGMLIKRISEYVLIHGNEYSLNNMSFEFVEEDEQMTYEDIMDTL